MQRGIVVLAISLICTSPALAKHKKTHHPFQASTLRHYHHAHRHRGARYAHRGGESSRGRPGAWCGWYMRQIMHVSDAAYNLARNWASYGHATSPHIGAIVVWPHHVGKITGGSPGHWVITSGNDGNRVRSRERSIAGAIAFRE